MTRALVMIAAVVVPTAIVGCGGSKSDSGDDPTPAEIEQLARCLTEKGWVVYGTSTCSGCRAQRKAFGDAWHLIAYVECDPHEAGAQSERCLKKKIRKTPTWILEVNGKELKRLEQYQLLEDLAYEAGCNFPATVTPRNGLGLSVVRSISMNLPSRALHSRTSW